MPYFISKFLSGSIAQKRVTTSGRLGVFQGRSDSAFPTEKSLRPVSSLCEPLSSLLSPTEAEMSLFIVTGPSRTTSASMHSQQAKCLWLQG
jgi:hypothetical protein